VRTARFGRALLGGALSTTARATLSRILPLAGLVIVVTFFVATADRAAVLAAMRQADGALVAVVVIGTGLVGWLADAVCLTWLVAVTLPNASRRVGLAEMLAIKAWSYLLNVVNYNAATVGMGLAVGNRVGVPMLEATAALAVLSYLDLLSLGALVSMGLAWNPDVATLLPETLRAWLVAVVGGSYVGALGVLLLLQSRLEHPLLERLRGLSVLRPLARLGPRDMLIGVALRAAFFQVYVVQQYGVLRAVGLQPQLATLWVVMPVIALVGVVPLSVSGIGTTQVAMRVLYRPFLPTGAAAGLIDAFSTLLIASVTALRLLLAVPFLGRFQAPKLDDQ